MLHESFIQRAIEKAGILAENEVITGIHYLDGGNSKHVFRIETDRRKIAAAVKKEPDSTIRDAHHFLRFLFERGASVPEPFGDIIFLPDGSALQLMSFIAGTPLPNTTEAYFQAGKTLAKIHTIADDYFDPSQPIRGRDPLEKMSHRWQFAGAILRQNDARLQLLGKECLNNGITMPSETRARITDLAANFTTLNPEESIVHGDVHTKQFIMSEGGPVLLDFEFSKLSYPMHDLAQFICWHVARPRGFSLEEVDTIIRDCGFYPELTNNFLQGYESVKRIATHQYPVLRMLTQIEAEQLRTFVDPPIDLSRNLWEKRAGMVLAWLDSHPKLGSANELSR